METQNLLSRIVRENDFEEWFYYISVNDEIIRYDVILLFFKTYDVSMYIVSTVEIDENDYDYYNQVIGLVHDLGADDDDDMEYGIDIKHAIVEIGDDLDETNANIEKTIEDIRMRERKQYS